MDIKITLNDIETKKLKQVKFDILTQREIKENAVCVVNETKILGLNSVYDLRMGAQIKDNKWVNCMTCNETMDCTGHFGKVELNVPICHPLYLEYIRLYLSYFCQYCFALLITKDQYKLLKFDKYNITTKLRLLSEFILKIKTCHNCNNIVPIYIKDDDDNKIYYYYMDKKNKVEITPSEIENIFGKIDQNDLKLLDIKINPLDLIFNDFPVLPPCSRPSVTMDGKMCDDDLTYKYIDIVKINNKLKEKLAEKKKKEFIDVLNFHIKTMFDNHKNKAKQITNKRPIKCLRSRIVGKGGRFRHDLSGKRVDFCGRTVFDIDPCLGINQVGLPMEWKKELTFPEHVNINNLDYWQKEVNNGKVKVIIRNNVKINLEYASKQKSTKLEWGDKVLRNGKEIHPYRYKMLKGKKFILQPNDKIKGLRENNGKYSVIITTPKLELNKFVKVQVDDICERELKDGDWILFNRQPSLHKYSILANQAKFINSKTIRLRPSLCGPLNADSDGDELNIHVPQTFQSVAEAKELISVEANIKGGRDSSTIISMCQDVITSGYLMTTPLKGNKNITNKMKLKYGIDFLNEFVIIDKAEFYNALCCIETWDFTYYEERMMEIQTEYSKHYKCSFEDAEKYVFTGHGLFSMLLPNSLNITYNNKIKKGNIPFIIKNGVMISGSIDKSVIGKKVNSLVSVLQSIYDSETALKFVNNYELIADYILLCNSFSVGIKDCFSKYDNCDGNDPINLIVQKEIDKCFEEAKLLYMTEKNSEILEKKINMVLNKSNTIGEKLSKESLTENNALKSMILSGAKGNFVNPAQIIGTLAQRNVNGCRIEKQFRDRTLPHYKKSKIDMLDPLSEDVEEDLNILFRSRGFIRSSYIKGLKADEFFFDMGSGRVGILETAIKTATVGYIARRLVKKMENYKSTYNNYIVNQKQNILSFDYNDGFDPSRTYLVNGKSTFTNVQILADKLMHEYEIENGIN